jgi:DNA polymerase-4
LSRKPSAIIHVDMDAFYAAVEMRDQPGLAGRPVVVGNGQRGVVAAASYEARRFGIHSAMPVSRARRLCPEAVFLPGRMARYREVSAQLQRIFARYTPLIEPLALDEAFLDVAGCERLWGDAASIGTRIKREIAAELGLVASVGVAPNKFLAKLASDLHKPDGFLVVHPGEEQALLDPLPITRLWGVGPATAAELTRLGIRRVGQLRALPEPYLVQVLGQAGGHLWRLAHGLDERAVVPDREAKSISHETTFSEDLHDPALLRDWLRELTGQVAARLRQAGLQGRQVTLKLRRRDFSTRSHSRTLPQVTDVTDQLWQVARRLFDELWQEDARPVRLIGIGVGQFGTPGQLQGDLFGSAAAERGACLDAVADRIVSRFGAGAIGRGLRRGGKGS